PVGLMVVDDRGVTVVVVLAAAAEAREQRVRRHRAEQRRSALGEDLEALVDDLDVLAETRRPVRVGRQRVLDGNAVEVLACRRSCARRRARLDDRVSGAAALRGRELVLLVLRARLVGLRLERLQRGEVSCLTFFGGLPAGRGLPDGLRSPLPPAAPRPAATRAAMPRTPS